MCMMDTKQEAGVYFFPLIKSYRTAAPPARIALPDLAKRAFTLLNVQSRAQVVVVFSDQPLLGRLLGCST